MAISKWQHHSIGENGWYIPIPISAAFIVNLIGVLHLFMQLHCLSSINATAIDRNDNWQFGDTC